MPRRERLHHPAACHLFPPLTKVLRDQLVARDSVRNPDKREGGRGDRQGAQEGSRDDTGKLVVIILHFLQRSQPSFKKKSSDEIEAKKGANL